ncbi:MAG: GNAT family N-acetyltransferase [Prevotella sp.]|jgi:diamine N-acetyltransferase|nr:GNAT family N-acetyltransferase [Prevotella sp.]
MSEQKVLLRALEPEDLDMLYQIENNRQLWDVGTTNVPYSRYALHDYIAHASVDIYTDKQVRLMIENQQGTIVGIVDIVDFNPQHLRAEVGIVITKEHRRQGYGKATLKEVLSYCRRILHIHQLYAIVDEDNEAALALFKSIGFTGERCMKDWLYDGKNYHDAFLLQCFCEK